MDVQEQLNDKTNQITNSYGLDLVEFNLVAVGATQQIRIVLDKQGGILLDDCAKVNKQLRKFIEEKQMLDDNFTIEVSSPGIDRKFTKIDDYARCIGRRIAIECRELNGKDCEFCGRLTAAADEEIKLLLDNEQEITIILNNIKKAKLGIG